MKYKLKVPRTNDTRLNIYIDPSVIHDLKIVAAERAMTIAACAQQFLTEGIERYAQNKPVIDEAADA